MGDTSDETMEVAQSLTDTFAGTGLIDHDKNMRFTHRELIETDAVVGKVAIDDGTFEDTKCFWIYYEKNGAWISPARKIDNGNRVKISCGSGKTYEGIIYAITAATDSEFGEKITSIMQDSSSLVSFREGNIKQLDIIHK